MPKKTKEEFVNYLHEKDINFSFLEKDGMLPILMNIMYTCYNMGHSEGMMDGIAFVLIKDLTNSKSDSLEDNQ